MPVDEAPEDEEYRETYNFAPGYHGLVYRADTPDHGAEPADREDANEGENEAVDDVPKSTDDGRETKYKLQSMKWGMLFYIYQCTTSEPFARKQIL